MTKLTVKVAALFFLVAIFLGFVLRGTGPVWGSDEASLRIKAADDSLHYAFSIVSEAKSDGGNVSGLVAELDEAGTLLASAEMAYTNGNMSSALNLANECIDKTGAITVEASALQDSASASSQTDFWLTVGFSIIGALAVVGVFFFAWNWFKRRYMKRLLGLKHEVISDAEA